MRARFLLGLACTVTSFAATNGSPSVAEAAKNQQKTALQALLKQKAPVNTPDVEGMTALMWAAHWNDVEMTQMLLKAGDCNRDADSNQELNAHKRLRKNTWRYRSLTVAALF